MKLKVTFLLLFCVITYSAISQESDDRAGVERACLDYIQGFYEGDTVKLMRSLDEDLHKFGFWKDQKSGKYGDRIFMSYDEAIEYANNVREKKQFPPADAPRAVAVLDLNDYIAAARVHAWWGVDYLLLSKRSGVWKIEQVIWQGPLN